MANETMLQKEALMTTNQRSKSKADEHAHTDKRMIHNKLFAFFPLFHFSYVAIKESARIMTF